MEIQKYDRENDAVVAHLTIYELEVLSEALRLSTCEPDERILSASGRENTPAFIVELSYRTAIIRDILAKLPGEIDAAIDFYRNLEK